VILEALGFDPWNILDSIAGGGAHLDMGSMRCASLWRYLLLGAVIVVPIWFVLRLARTPHGR